MAGELRAVTAPGAVVYAHVFNSASRLWNGSAFEAFDSGSYTDYSITMTEQGSTGVYVGDFPAGITDAGEYGIVYHLREGGAQAEGDPVVSTGVIEWDGSSIAAEEDVSSGEMSGSDWLTYVLRAFKRTDKDDEVFDETNAAIAEIRRRIVTSRDEKETATTDTISTLGEYRIDVETDWGLPVSDVFIRDANDGRYLIPISKARFDQLYSIYGTTGINRARPEHYCIFANQIHVGPVPDKTDYVYVTSYGRTNLTPVTSDSEAVPYTTKDYKEIMRHGVLFRLYGLLENDTQEAKHLAFWEKGLREIEEVERKKRRAVHAVAYNDC